MTEVQTPAATFAPGDIVELAALGGRTDFQKSVVLAVRFDADGVERLDIRVIATDREWPNLKASGFRRAE